MANENIEQWENQAEIFKALGHPTRLFIVSQLESGPQCVSDLTEMIGADISTVSRHLDVLVNCGLLAKEKEGTTVNYRLRLPCVLQFFDCVEEVLTADADEPVACETDFGGGQP